MNLNLFTITYKNYIGNGKSLAIREADPAILQGVRKYSLVALVLGILSVSLGTAGHFTVFPAALNLTFWTLGSLFVILGSFGAKGAHVALDKNDMKTLVEKIHSFSLTVLIASLFLVGLGTCGNYTIIPSPLNNTFWVMGSIGSILGYIARKGTSVMLKPEEEALEIKGSIDRFGDLITEGVITLDKARDWDYPIMASRFCVPRSKRAKVLYIIGIILGIAIALSPLWGHSIGFNRNINIAMISGGSFIALTSLLLRVASEKNEILGANDFAARHPRIWKLLAPLHLAQGMIKWGVNSAVVEPISIFVCGIIGTIKGEQKYKTAALLALINVVASCILVGLIVFTPNGANFTLWSSYLIGMGVLMGLRKFKPMDSIEDRIKFGLKILSYIGLIITYIALSKTLEGSIAAYPKMALLTLPLLIEGVTSLKAETWVSKSNIAQLIFFLASTISAFVLSNFFSDIQPYLALGIYALPFALYQANCYQNIEVFSEKYRGSLIHKMAMERAMEESSKLLPKATQAISSKLAD